MLFNLFNKNTIINFFSLFNKFNDCNDNNDSYGVFDELNNMPESEFKCIIKNAFNNIYFIITTKQYNIILNKFTKFVSILQKKQVYIFAGKSIIENNINDFAKSFLKILELKQLKIFIQISINTIDTNQLIIILKKTKNAYIYKILKTVPKKYLKKYISKLFKNLDKCRTEYTIYKLITSHSIKELNEIVSNYLIFLSGE